MIIEPPSSDWIDVPETVVKFIAELRLEIARLTTELVMSETRPSPQPAASAASDMAEQQNDAALSILRETAELLKSYGLHHMAKEIADVEKAKRNYDAHNKLIWAISVLEWKKATPPPKPPAAGKTPEIAEVVEFRNNLLRLEHYSFHTDIVRDIARKLVISFDKIQPATAVPIDIKALQDAGRFYQSVPQDILRDCLKALEPFEEEGRPNCLVNMVQYVCVELAKLRAATAAQGSGVEVVTVEELSRRLLQTIAYGYPVMETLNFISDKFPNGLKISKEG